jgi:hypothetical protein
MGFSGVVNGITSPAANNLTDAMLLTLRCKELEHKNKILQQQYDELKHQSSRERKMLEIMKNTLQLDMDTMKKTTSGLEDQVTSLLLNFDVNLSVNTDATTVSTRKDSSSRKSNFFVSFVEFGRRSISY